MRRYDRNPRTRGHARAAPLVVFAAARGRAGSAPFSPGSAPTRRSRRLAAVDVRG